MKPKEFDQLVEGVFHTCKEILKAKGDAYTQGKDRFANFNRLSNDLALDRKIVWKVYFQKHLDAINSRIAGQYNDPEPISSRIVDAINYLLLLHGMIEEENEEDV